MSLLALALDWIFRQILQHLACAPSWMPPPVPPRRDRPPGPPADFSHLMPRPSKPMSWREEKASRATGQLQPGRFAHLRGCAPFKLTPLPPATDGE